MKIVTISGSPRPDSKNTRLVKSLSSRYANLNFEYFDISVLPLFLDQGGVIDYPYQVITWKEILINANALIITTPEYIHNIPASLKNALEWVTQSGELHQKKVLPITFTPAHPRGEKAMQSLLWSLKALECNVVGQLDLYQSDITIEDGVIDGSEESLALLDEGIKLITNN